MSLVQNLVYGDVIPYTQTRMSSTVTFNASHHKAQLPTVKENAYLDCIKGVMISQTSSEKRFQRRDLEEKVLLVPSLVMPYTVIRSCMENATQSYTDINAISTLLPISKCTIHVVFQPLQCR